MLVSTCHLAVEEDAVGQERNLKEGHLIHAAQMLTPQAGLRHHARYQTAGSPPPL